MRQGEERRGEVARAITALQRDFAPLRRPLRLARFPIPQRLTSSHVQTAVQGPKGAGTAPCAVWARRCLYTVHEHMNSTVIASAPSHPCHWEGNQPGSHRYVLSRSSGQSVSDLRQYHSLQRWVGVVHGSAHRGDILPQVEGGACPNLRIQPAPQQMKENSVCKSCKSTQSLWYPLSPRQKEPSSSWYQKLWKQRPCCLHKLLFG